MKAGKPSGLIVLLVWIIVAAIIWFRNIDGAGVAQKVQLKEVTLMIWLIFAIPIAIGYVIWFIILKRRQKASSKE
ncbi:DUF3923 family protein [Lactobacillus acidophilus]|uniref:DUF3923 family protein n=1 Tax=Lactobacillus acidophilus TaxID=1579 RepID=UPI000354F3ED|nr:DUF3923 family protein [Lactobacillus acidophilus]MBN3484209.1 DUF3923 family protein [Lactobacillus acidophilus]MCT3627790.1 DUF3923 family protein [Lactobacillus acidophilus]UEX75306.1 DUF3923 family protein [Lactobacillus acidophilus]UIP47819.1 DUF3923 family protein [Lactobacillus acidophilus]UTX29996.1 DUF3923 family protein [Lactobacillus acidophilus]